MSALARERILLVNDDGIHGPGLTLLERLVREVCDDVWVVAPDEERSGSAHSLSITVPVRARQISEKRFAIKGTPTDCVLLAHHELMRDAPPTLVLSGINRGANLGEDVTYSGTLSAALEGVLLGMRAIAISQIFTFGQEPHWKTSERYTIDLLERLVSAVWPPDVFYNINLPDCAADAVTGIRVTSQGRRPPGSFVPERRTDGRDVPYYWIRLLHKEGEFAPDTDLAVVADDAISVTPLHPDMTRGGAMAELRRVIER